jgi:hypothetical protein
LALYQPICYDRRLNLSAWDMCLLPSSETFRFARASEPLFNIHIIPN